MFEVLDKFWRASGRIFIIALLLFSEQAFSSPSYINLQTRISKPNDAGYLESNSVQFRMTITDPIGTCVVYQEEFANVDMTGSKGLINFKIGSGTKIYPAGPLPMPSLFTNFNSVLFNCQAGGTYTAASSDARKLVMQFNDGSGWQTVPSMEINSVPFSLEALASQKLGSFPAADYVRTAQFTSCTGSEAVHFNGTNFTCVALGAGGSSYSAITGATGANTIDNTNHAQTWNWSTASTQNPMTMTANALTTGSLIRLTTSNNSLNSTNGLLNVANTGTSTTGTVARIQSNSAAGSGLTVLANGNVGIGTASPTTKLEVNGAVLSNTSLNVNTGTGTGGNGMLTVGDGAATTWELNYPLQYSGYHTSGGARFGFREVNNGTETFVGSMPNSLGAVGTQSNHPFSIYTNGSAKVTALANGNVGIGTTSPGQVLTVSGTIESTSGGIKFPDGTTQTTARLNYGFSAQAVSAQSIASAVSTVVVFGTENWDIGNNYDPTTGDYSPPVTGIYQCNCQVNFESLGANADFFVGISGVNIAGNATISSRNRCVGAPCSSLTSQLIKANSSAIIRCVVYQASGSSANLTVGPRTFFGCHYMGPSN